MDKSKQLVLSGDELTLVDEALANYLEELTGSASAIEPIRARGFRLMVKLSKVLGERAKLWWDLKPWQIPILQRTFAPDPPAPAKKTAPAKTSSKNRARAGKAAPTTRTTSSAGAKPAGSPAPSPSPKVPVAASAALDAGSPTGSSSPGAATPLKLSPSLARRRGGLLRAAQAAEAKNDTIKAAQYRARAAQLVTSAAAADADS